MCYALGSIDQAIGTCPMCKVFKPQGRCPHVKETCRNRALHPRHDVVYLKNAEVQTFNGCGFCKWARSNTSSKLSGYQNPGWPGCCRAPNPADNKLIQAADWPTVSLVHHVPIPVEIKAILESLTGQRGSNTINGGSIRGTLPAAQSPSISRRSTSAVTVPTRVDITPVKSSPVSMPARTRSGGSPQQLTASPIGGTPSSLPNSSAIEQAQNSQRRPLVDTQLSKPRESSRELKHSPNRRSVELTPSRRSVEIVSNRKPVELTGSLARRGSSQKPSISAVTTSMFVNKVTVDASTSNRRTASNTNMPPSSNPVIASRSSAERERGSTITSKDHRRKSSLEASIVSLSISSGSSASSDSGGSSETTVISDGFTDYLSDESDAELQRQAEIKAALLAQTQMEEQEFKAARQQLANIDLHPPKSWTSNVNAMPRSMNASSSNPGSAYRPQSLVSSSYLAAQSGSHSRV